MPDPSAFPAGKPIRARPSAFRPRTSLVLVFLFVLLAGASQLISYSVSRNILADAFQKQQRDKVESVGGVISGMIGFQVRRVHQIAEILAQSETLPRLLMLPRQERDAAVSSELDSIYRVAGVDVLEVTDDREIVLYRAHDPERRGDLIEIWGVTEALQGRCMTATAVRPDGVTIHAVEPLYAGEKIVGTLIAGIRLNEALLKRMGDDLGAGLAVLTRTGVITASGLAVAAHIDPEAVTEAFYKKIPIYRDDAVNRHTNVYLPLMIVDEAFVVLASVDSRYAYNMFVENTNQTALNAFFILLGGVLLAIAALRYVLRPLRRLRTFADAAAVRFSGESIRSEYKDEVAGVAHVLENLASRLIHRYQELADAMNDGLWDLDVASGALYLSPRYYTMLGYHPGEFEASVESWLELIHPDDREDVKTALAACVEGSGFCRIEFRVRSKSGQLRYILGRARAVETGEDGRVKRVLGTHMDITDRKQAESELRQSEEKFSTLFRLSPDCIVVADIETQAFVDVNEAFARLIGRPRDQILGKTTIELDLYKDMSRRDEIYAQIASKGRVDDLEGEFKRADGRVGVFSLSGRVVRIRDRRYILSIIRDITETKRAHDELKAAKERAEAANRAKSEFLANMSHEIRTPLNGIAGILQLLRTTALNVEQEEYAQMALQSSRRLTRLLSDILDLSQVEAGKLEIRSETFNLADTVQQICELFESTSRQTEVRLRCIVDPSIPERLVGDSSRLQQILNNLVGNAFKYTPSGEIVVEASLLRTARTDQHVILFTVSDTGIGIPDDKFDKLFKPFSQVSEGYSRSYQGAGLGLSICKRLVELLGGSITVDSEPGKGTTFYFTVILGPAKDEPEEAEKDQSRPEYSALPLRILIAEDDPTSGFSTKALLEKIGCSPTLAADGREVLDILSREDFDLVLMDVQMPDMDGVQATMAIREGRAGKDKMNIPIVALTAYAMSGDKERFLKAGMDDYLMKPLEINALRKKIAEFGRNSN